MTRVEDLSQAVGRLEDSELERFVHLTFGISTLEWLRRNHPRWTLASSGVPA